MVPNPIKCTPKALPTQCKNCHSFSFFFNLMILGGYPLGVMGKNRQPPALQKMKCLPPWALYFFEAPTTTLCLIRCLATTPRRKQEKEKSNQDFMNPFEAHSHLFLCLNLAFSTTSLPMLQSSNSLSWCIISCSMTVGGNAVTILPKAPPLAVTKPSELAAAESHSQSRCSLQMGGAICMNIQKTVPKA